MATAYNHRLIEGKWRKQWEEHPINVEDGRSRSITVWTCFHIHPDMVFMQDIGEVMLSQMYGAVTN